MLILAVLNSFVGYHDPVVLTIPQEKHAERGDRGDQEPNGAATLPVLFSLAASFIACGPKSCMQTPLAPPHNVSCMPLHELKCRMQDAAAVPCTQLHAVVI